MSVSSNMLLLDWFILYITFVVVYIKLYWEKINAFFTHKNTVTKISNRTYELRFYIGKTLCKLVVERNRGPPKFHKITSDEVDVSEDVLPYLAVTPKSVTPRLLGFEKLELWKADGDSTEVLPDLEL